MTAAEIGQAQLSETGSSPLLRVEDLSVAFGTGPHMVTAVDHVSLDIDRGHVYGLVGESGCGKSTLAYSLLRVVPPPGRITGGRVLFDGQDLATSPKRELNRLRGARLSMVFQGAMNAFNPVITIGAQVDHVVEAHPDVFAKSAQGRAYFEYLLELVGLDPKKIWPSYESRLSGGMKQRVAIAIGLLLRPDLLILDEPTTALDVLNQRLVIDILRRLHQELSLTIVFATHDLAVVAELATRVDVMYAGKLVESGTVREIFSASDRHPYVKALVDAIPDVFDVEGRAQAIAGQVPNLAALPKGCRFAPRCQLAEAICRDADPPLVEDASGHAVACHVVNRRRREGVAR